MIKSMTGFASRTGASAPFSWSWELRSVNGRGLDIRVRAPDWVDGLEAGLRKKISGLAARGNVTCNLRLTREETGGSLEVNAGQLESVLSALQEIEARAMDAGVSLAPSKATDIVALRGVLEHANPDDDAAALCAILLADADGVLGDFDKMRQAEGTALDKVIAAQLDEIETLTGQAKALSTARAQEMSAHLRAALARVMDGAEGVDDGRVAQELAMIGVKADITEEIDRLHAHVKAARDLLGAGGAVGRKLDFLTQEFNREANTLCSKAQMKELTSIGLALKAVIDQMREQVQNVE